MKCGSHLVQNFLQGEGYRDSREDGQALEVYLRHKDGVSVVVLTSGFRN
jgi:hypothetical protein